MVLNRKILCALLLLLAGSFVFAENKIALVIGNGSYSVSPLKNPVNDAKSMKTELEKIGFKVIFGTDLQTVDDMDEKLIEYYKESKGADISLFFYSGHGVQYESENYLLPVGEEIKKDKDIERKAIALNDVISEAGSSGCRQLVVIIDACRNNPVKKTRGTSKGLSVVDNSEIAQSIVFFACAAGKTADDGEGIHSPFTQALLNNIGEAGATFTSITRKVKLEVQEMTNNQQSPNTIENITDDIYLNGRDKKKDDDDNKKHIYKKDATDYGKIITLCVVLFLILIAVMLVCFAFFTVEGKRVFEQIKSGVMQKTSTGLSFIQKKAVKIRDDVQVITNNQKEKSALKKEEVQKQKQMAIDELVAKEAAEKQIMENFILPSVKVDSLYVAKMPITVGQYRVITGMTISADEKHPVTNISWIQALECLNQLSEKEGLEKVYDLSDKSNIKIDLTKNGWRLPFENEWKSFADVPADFEQSVWYTLNSNAQVSDCCKKNCNKNGLYDVYGLVWEWCNDVFENWHILKGGSWDSAKKDCSKKARLAVTKDFTSDAAGFRGVRNI